MRARTRLELLFVFARRASRYLACQCGSWCERRAAASPARRRVPSRPLPFFGEKSAFGYKCSAEQDQHKADAWPGYIGLDSALLVLLAKGCGEKSVPVYLVVGKWRGSFKLNLVYKYELGVTTMMWWLGRGRVDGELRCAAKIQSLWVIKRSIDYAYANERCIKIVLYYF